MTPFTLRCCTFWNIAAEQPGHLLGGGLRRGDDVRLGPGQELRERQGDVAGAGRHVDEQEVGVVPVDVGEELLERLVQHRAAPDDRLVLGHEEADGDAAHAVRLGRQEHLVDDHRVRSMPSIRGIEKPYTSASMMATRLPRWASATARFVGDRRLADAALARAISSGGCANPGRRRGSPDPRRGRAPAACPAVAAGSPWRRWRSAARSSSVITVKSRRRRWTPSSTRERAVDTAGDLAPAAGNRDGEGDRDVDASSR